MMYQDIILIYIENNIINNIIIYLLYLIMTEEKGIIDIYKYKIHNYPSDKKIYGGIKFGSIETRLDSDNEETGIKVDNTFIDKTKTDKLILSIDTIKSTTSINNKYYKMYKNENAKHNRGQLTIEDFHRFNDLVKNVNSKLLAFLDDELVSLLFNESTIEMKISKTGYIRKIRVNNNDNIIMFGDIHGSFHTFFRNLLRLHIYGVLDLNTYTINDNYKIIFLGDIIDRGQHSIEILEMLFLFIKNDTNNNKIFINQGNHEEFYLAKKYGFIKELNTAFSSLDVNLSELINNIFNFFRKCSTGIIIQNIENKQNYWASHGYIPSLNTIDKYIKQFLDYSTNETIMLILDDNSILEVKWNDPSIKNTNSESERGNEIYDVGLSRLKEIRDLGFSFIIRGHNDKMSNASLLCSSLLENEDERYSSYFVPLGLVKYNYLLKGDERLTNNTDSVSKYIDGPIEQINTDYDLWSIDLSKESKYYPVLTISTNTDIGRNLTSDSFIVLHFKKKLYVPALTNKKISISEYLNSTYYKKYLKYKRKYLLLTNKLRVTN